MARGVIKEEDAFKFVLEEGSQTVHYIFQLQYHGTVVQVPIIIHTILELTDEWRLGELWLSFCVVNFNCCILIYIILVFTKIIDLIKLGRCEVHAIPKLTAYKCGDHHAMPIVLWNDGCLATR